MRRFVVCVVAGGLGGAVGVGEGAVGCEVEVPSVFVDVVVVFTAGGDEVTDIGGDGFTCNGPFGCCVTGTARPTGRLTNPSTATSTKPKCPP
jgi:hypothetical protein